jgi:hypothetical protein
VNINNKSKENHMGDKSPKAVNKAATQKQNKLNIEAQKKQQQAAAAKQEADKK